ncbi:MAG: hypothetical protein KJI72_01460 [Patescibacteria group bacterium]|nr:hypothetical protein [Patescibacteria group bacterium]
MNRSIVLLVGVLLGCTDSHAPSTVELPGPLTGPMELTVSVLGEPTELSVPTYDGSGQTVHPDILHFSLGWNGWNYWMAITPYPNGNARLENPSIVVSQDGMTWLEPEGITNPVAPLEPGALHNSDPDLLYDSFRDRLVLTWREVRDGNNVIKTRVSEDGIDWHSEQIAFQEPNHSAVSQAASRSLVLVDGLYPKIWYVDSGSSGCRATSTEVKMRSASGLGGLGSGLSGANWSEPVVTAFDQPGYVIWHIDVVYIPSSREYWAIYAAYPSGSGCGDNDLFFARSADGVVWETYATPFLEKGFADWASRSLYRASFVYGNGGVLRVWFSTLAGDGTWHLGFVSYDFASFTNTLESQ